MWSNAAARGAAKSVLADWRRASYRRVRSAKTFKQLYSLLFTIMILKLLMFHMVGYDFFMSFVRTVS